MRNMRNNAYTYVGYYITQNTCYRFIILYPINFMKNIFIMNNVKQVLDYCIRDKRF